MKQQTRLRRDRWRRTGEWNSEGHLGLSPAQDEALGKCRPSPRCHTTTWESEITARWPSSLAWGTNVHYACPCRAGCLRTAPTCYAWMPKKGVDQESRKIAVMSHLKLPMCPTSSLGQLDKIGPVVQYTFQLYRQTGNGRAAW